MNKREQKRLEAAEHVCRYIRKAWSYHATRHQYEVEALQWLIVWLRNAPKRVQDVPLKPAKRKRVEKEA